MTHALGRFAAGEALEPGTLGDRADRRLGTYVFADEGRDPLGALLLQQQRLLRLTLLHLTDRGDPRLVLRFSRLALELVEPLLPAKCCGPTLEAAHAHATTAYTQRLAEALQRAVCAEPHIRLEGLTVMSALTHQRPPGSACRCARAPAPGGFCR